KPIREDCGRLVTPGEISWEGRAALPASHIIGRMPKRPRSSRRRYLGFVQDYKQHRLDDAGPEASVVGTSEPQTGRPGKRREYLREYVSWLWPHRSAVFAFFGLALLAAGLQMVDPLFMRFIIDRVLLNTGLSPEMRLSRLSLAGALFLVTVLLSNLLGAFK